MGTCKKTSKISSLTSKRDKESRTKKKSETEFGDVFPIGADEGHIDAVQRGAGHKADCGC